MSMLKKVQTGPVKRNHFILVYGVDGVGKSTLGASAPNPIFLGPEDGLGLLEVARFPSPSNWAEVKQAVSDLLHEEHDYQTLVIDSLDWIEPLVWSHVCKEDGVTSIEQVGGGFGKGYVAALQQWQELIKLLNRLRAKMHIILIAHSQIKPFTDPSANGESYDRYILKLNEKAGALWREACDCVLFANFETRVTKKKGAMKAQAFGDGARVMFTERRPAFDAKNRFDLPFEMDLAWDAFHAATTKVKSTAQADKGDDFARLLNGHEKPAEVYLLSIGWLKEGQSLSDLSANRRRTIVNKGEAFLDVVREHAQPESTNE